ncbi:PAX3 and PAX7-binding protein 1 [Taenia solium]|eukprot:TsM_000619700 transcript=TsM_000619700 gene=TsM_000619700
MFRKPRRAYRVQRKEESDGEAEESPSDSSQIPDANPVVPIRPSGTKVALSFGDDLEESETFKVKRSAHSRRVLKQLKEGKSSLKSGASDPPSTTKGLLSECTQSHPVKLEESSGSSDITHEDETIKVRPLNRASSEQFSTMLKQGVIPDASTIHMVRKQRQQAKFQLEAEEENFSPPHPSSNDGRRLVREEDDDEEEDYEGGGANIYHHRRPAFTLTAEYRDPKSRRRVEISRGLQRKRDREQEEDKERRSMFETESASKNKRDERDVDDDADDDEEDDTWERQQIQKAVSSKNTAVLEALEPSPSADGGLLPKPSRRLADFGDVTLASIKSILQERLDKKQKAMHENKVELLSLKEDLSHGQATISASRTKLPELANTLAFYMELREYVRDVISCFNEKMLKIEYMDKRSTILYRERADALMARRRTDVGDMADEAAGPAASGENTTSQKTLEARKRRKADREARCARRRRQAKPDEAYDKRIEAIIGVSPPCEGVSSDDEEPQAVIAKRAADFGDIKRDAEHLFDDVVEEYCSIPAILQRFREWRERAVKSYGQAYIPMCLPQLLAPLIRLQMLTWNPLEANCPFFDEYGWFGCLLDYFADLQQVEDLERDASEEGDAQRRVLLTLATSPEHELAVIPLVIEKVLLPRLTVISKDHLCERVKRFVIGMVDWMTEVASATKYLEVPGPPDCRSLALPQIVSASWDPMSWSQTRRLVTVVRSFATLWPTVSAESKATQRLFEAVLQRMEHTIQMDVFIPLYSKRIMSDLQCPSRLFFDRQMNAAMKLLSNLLEWHDLLAPAALKYVTFTCLVNRYILIGLASLMSNTTTLSDTGGGGASSEMAVWESVTERLKAIAVQLPPEWLTDPEDNQLAQLRRFVGQLIERLAPQDVVTGVETKEEMEMRTVLKKLKRIQSRLFSGSSV